jgi:hypothetical protein
MADRIDFFLNAGLMFQRIMVGSWSLVPLQNGADNQRFTDQLSRAPRERPSAVLLRLTIKLKNEQKNVEIEKKENARLLNCYLLAAFFSLASWNRFFTALILAFCASISLVTKVKASSGHHLTHCGPSGSSLQLLHVNTTFFSGCIIMAPNGHALMHQAQPLQASSSTIIIPVFSS